MTECWASIYMSNCFRILLFNPLQEPTRGTTPYKRDRGRVMGFSKGQP